MKLDQQDIESVASGRVARQMNRNRLTAMVVAVAAFLGGMYLKDSSFYLGIGIAGVGLLIYFYYEFYYVSARVKQAKSKLVREWRQEQAK